MISKISEKHFFGKNLIHVDVFRKNDERTVYNVVYLDGGSKRTMVKRFSITGMVRDKEYDITQGSAGSEILYMTVNKNAEAEKITIHLSNLASARVKQFDYDFAQLAVKNRGAQGNLLTRYPVRKVDLKEKGRSTAGGRKIWYEPEVGRLNSDGHGQYLGEFDGDDRILVIWNDGSYELTTYELTNRYDSDKVYFLQKFWPEQPITAFYYHKGNDQWYMKRFLIETLSVDKKFSFIGEEPGNQLLACSTAENPSFEAHFTDAKKVKQQQVLEAGSFTDLKGWKAQGTRFTGGKIQKLVLLSEKVGDYQPPVSTVAENMANTPGDQGGEGGQLNLL
jgi:topoisomerase-4 subunit A